MFWHENQRVCHSFEKPFYLVVVYIWHLLNVAVCHVLIFLLFCHETIVVLYLIFIIFILN